MKNTLLLFFALLLLTCNKDQPEPTTEFELNKNKWEALPSAYFISRRQTRSQALSKLPLKGPRLNCSITDLCKGRPNY